MGLGNQFAIEMENKRGALASLCSELAKLAVNISAIQVGDQPGRALVRIVASPPEPTKKVLEKMGCSYREETIVTVHLPDRPGALGRVTRKLAEKGIDIHYAYGTIEHGHERAMIVLGVSDPQAASQIVK